MRWKTPKNKWYRGFALFPVHDGSETIWLQFYWFRSNGIATDVSFDRECPTY